METEVNMTYADLLKELIEQNQRLLIENEKLKQQIKKSPCCEQDDQMKSES